MKKQYLPFCVFVLLFICAACASGANPQVVLETNFGNIIIELYPDDAPVTVDNFLDYVNSGFYDGLLFHRVIYGFMIQAGLYYVENNLPVPSTPEDPIINESFNGLSNLRGTIAMARLGEDEFGNPQPDSATSQFFINHVDNLGLDRAYCSDGYGYCVFGKMVDGMDVVDAIAQTPTYDYSSYFGPAFQNFPNYPIVIILSAYVLSCDVSYCSDLASVGRISFADFAMFASYWLDDCNSANGFCSGADLDYSGNVDIVDLDLFWQHWNRTTGYEPQYSDLINDKTINLGDIETLASHWLDSGCEESNNYCDRADINRDGVVDFTDYALLSGNWLTSY